MADREEFADAADVTAAVSNDSGVTVNRVAVRLAPFWCEDPDLWFTQVEAQFETAGIKIDSTKYYTVLQQLDHKTMREVRDVITNPPEDGKYEKLKQELLKRLSVSNQHRLRQLMIHEEMGDRKPSQFLRHLRSLGGKSVNDEFLRSIWMDRLPTHLQPIIASRQSEVNLDDVADLADRIFDVSHPATHSVASSASGTMEAMFQNLEKNIATRIKSEISQQIAQLNLGRGRCRTTYNQGKPRSWSNSRRRPTKSGTPGLCWYHDNFGERARKCVAPCKFGSENLKGSQ